MQQFYNIQEISPFDFETQLYAESDTRLISQFEDSEIFNPDTNYIEFFIYDADRRLISNESSNYNNYRIYNNEIAIDPKTDVESAGFEEGYYYTYYNFLTNILGSNRDQRYYISQISSDRTEIRLSTTTIDPTTIIEQTEKFIGDKENVDYYLDFYLNFDNNRLLIANNIALDTSNPIVPTVLVKLYEPLPLEFGMKSEVWAVEMLAQPVAFSVEITTTFDDEIVGIPLRGPNLNLNIKNEVNTSDIYYTFNTLNQTTQATGTGSLQYKLNSLLVEKGIEIDIDYSSFSNFIHFSSAETRLENFYYKLSLLEQYQASASLGLNTNTYNSASQAFWQSKIDNIITNFDGYEYYLYYESASTAWPKVNSSEPYINYPTTSQTASVWLTANLITASNYDLGNKDALVYSIPPYLKDDPANQPYELFVEMIGQHFDIVWTYTKDITSRYNADNRLNYGISKDLVVDVLRDLGVKIYQNNFTTQNLYSSLLGVTPSGSLLNIPNTTLTLPAGTGLEYINTFVTASNTSSIVPLSDANKELYKRIYHNLPYILKKKGTVAGLKTLLTVYGIPDTVIRINEFGGQDKINADDWDNWQDTFNYAFNTQGQGFVSASWNTFNSGSGAPPTTVLFRFKAENPLYTNYSQSLLTFSGSSNYALVLEYSGSGLASSSAYSGSNVDPYYQYGTLKWISGSVSASVYQPFFNNDWWSVMVTAVSSSHRLYAKQKDTYELTPYIKYESTSSFNNSGSLTVIAPSASFLGGSGSLTIAGKNYIPFTGSFQEFRFYKIPLEEYHFDNYVMNPYSIEGNSLTGNTSPQASLLFRAALGTDLRTYSGSSTIQSIHPAVTGSYITQSFLGGSSYYLQGQYTFKENQEFIYQTQPNVGIQSAVSDKIKIVNQTIPTGNTLSKYRSVQQHPINSGSTTSDVNYVEVALSPQDEINDDIIAQLGYFNYGDYIGDPRFESSSATSYPQLDALRDTYFSKYSKNYNLGEYLRLIKFFDNSLFKMIKDYVPARTGLATGAVIKQHLLERNRYRPPQPSWEDQTYTGSVTTLSTGYDTGSKIYTFSGSTGGSFPYLTSYTSSGYYPPFVDISQSWSREVVTPLGPTTVIENTLEEFYNGELEGTTITAAHQSLIDADCQLFLDTTVAETDYAPVYYTYTITSEDNFLSEVSPRSGEISIYYIREFLAEGAPNRPQTSTQ